MNLHKNRPLSPHLQIYRWQVTMFLSILHRLSGFGLAIGAGIVAWFLCALALGHDTFEAFRSIFGSFVGRMVLYLLLLGLVFHFLNGIRHLVWDAGKGINKKAAAISGWIVFVASIIASMILWFWATEGLL